ncbi:MAG: PRC-barrel domain-containing protein [Candidatus Binatales bacterium]
MASDKKIQRSHARKVLSASSLTSHSVKSKRGEDLGSVKEIMIDITSGRIAYAVLSFGRLLGIDNKLFAIPWEVLTVDEDRKCLVLDADKASLEKAPGFDEDHWPDMADWRWGKSIYSYYGPSRS